MHKRKVKMANLTDGFIALPGEPGTFKEFFEILMWLNLAFIINHVVS